MSEQMTTTGDLDRDDLNVWPGLTYDDAPAARQWLARLGFLEGVCVVGDDPATIVHSEMIWPEGGRVMVSTRGGKEDPTFEVPRGAASCYVVTADPRAAWERAQAVGATVLRPMEDTDYGSTGFSVADPEGNRFSFGTYAGRNG